jgi:hypothetical protein
LWVRQSISIQNFCLYFGLIIGAFFIQQSLDVPLVHKGDVVGYVDYGHALITNDFQLIAYSTRTYGYPLFLACVVQASNFFNLPSFYALLFATQFALHIVTAGLAALIAQRFMLQRAWITPLVFATIAWNPYLLAMITQPLTETLSVFWITLFFYLVQSEYWHPHLLHRMLIGIILGLATVTRPFHLIWGAGMIGLLLIAALWEDAIERQIWRRILSIMQIVACFLLICSTQIMTDTIYTLYAWDVPKPPTIDLIEYHRKLAVYSYRYETSHNLSENAVYPALYVNQRLYPDGGQPEEILMPFIKLTSLFQQHDYRTYRPVLGIVSSGAFAVGFVLWVMFCYVVPQSMLDVWRALRGWKPIPLASLFSFALLLYVLLYTFFTVPEPRFILPILPLLVCLFAFYAARSTRRWPFLAALGVAILSYGLTAYTLLWALQTT